MIKQRNNQGRFCRIEISKEILQTLYLQKHLKPVDIAKKLDTSVHFIYERLHEYNLYKKMKKNFKNHKLNCTCGRCMAIRGELIGRNNPSYKEGRTLLQYYCKCGNKITYRTKLYGLGQCRTCWYKNNETKQKMSNSAKGKKVWNKGTKGLTTCWAKGLDIKNKEANHHIDSNHQNNNAINLLKTNMSNHTSLHWRGYEYLVEKNLIFDYLNDFIQKYEIIETKIDDGKVVHHIDCNRKNNDSSNLLYLKDRKIHNKLHQEAYKYLVRINKVYDYLDWFFSKKEKNNQQSGTIEEKNNHNLLKTKEI